ncbi:hypothetical protein ABZV68_32530 [Streptomyces clavifer]|uniref:hypothetical protein n=1 Tax=Streptomyces clavifer TaxID=68188 RepID=UPI0033BD52FB
MSWTPDQPYTPLPPYEVELACEYLLAVQNPEVDGVSALIESTHAEPMPTFILLRLSEDIIRPVTDLADDADPNADSFVLHKVGDILLAALEEWTRSCLPSALFDIAHIILGFAEGILRKEGKDIIDTLKTMRTEHLERATLAA